MGYYVSTTDINFIIPEKNIREAFRAVKALNNRNDLKSGGSLGYGTTTNPPSDRPHPDVWFSWMEWNYHETCPDLGSVMKELGFDIDYSETGDLYLGGYDSKIGSEEHFIEVLAPFAEPGSYIEWLGEDGARWRHEVIDGQLITKTGTVVWE